MNKIKRFLKMFLYSFVSKRTLIIIIILLLLLLLKNNVQAVDYVSFTETYNNTEYTFNIDDRYFSNYTYYIVLFNTPSWARWPYVNILMSNGEMKHNGTDTWVSTSTIYYRGQGLTSTTYTINYGDIQTKTTSYKDADIAPSGIITSNYTVLDTNGNPVFTPEPPEPPEPIEPYFTDTLLNLTNLNISNIVVDSGNQQLVNDEIIFKISTRPKGSPVGDTVYTTILSPSSEFYNANGVNGAYYEIPVESFKDFLTAGYELTYYLEWRLTETPAQRDNSEITVVYNPQAETVDDIELLNASLNSNFNKLNNTIINNFNNLSQQQQQMIVQQQEAVDTAKDTNQFLKNDNFDNGNLNLPTSQGEDITQDGINNIFTMIYNAFTSGEAPDIIVPVPFTGKSFTIQANFLRNILNGTQFTFISNIIELFWWYIISKFIVQDIAKKMNKIKSGDLENLENSNIKEEML